VDECLLQLADSDNEEGVQEQQGEAAHHMSGEDSLVDVARQFCVKEMATTQPKTRKYKN
jgi:hypothetical protein